mmetsp:Transcript_126585/g.253095  ORF Transcript_126585/g.253095 Transcript_126585/m.253095 type:complete len:276 (+) Transcript_126585:75-902(+)
MSKPLATSCSIFVGNVPYDAQEDELRDLFSKVGNVTSVRVVCDKDTRQPKGYAFCDFVDASSVHAAIEKLNNMEYNGRKLRIDWAERELHTPTAKPIEDRPADNRMGTRSSAGGGGGGGGVPADPPPLPAPVPTVADRLARLREQEAMEQARIAAADATERAEIRKLMEVLTPQQVLHVLGEMQRLAIRAPEVARALLNENLQLALALQHAELLVGVCHATIKAGGNVQVEPRLSLSQRLERLSPQEIDKLPDQTKAQLLEFLQSMPADRRTASS